MLVKAAVLSVSIFIAGNVFAAESLTPSWSAETQTHSGNAIRFDPYATISHHRASAAPKFLPTSPGIDARFSDAEDLRRLGSNARELRTIAVAASIGDRTSVEIASARLSNFGVTREQLHDAINWTKLHGNTADTGHTGHHRIEADANSVWTVNY